MLSHGPATDRLPAAPGRARPAAAPTPEPAPPARRPARGPRHREPGCAEGRLVARGGRRRGRARAAPAARDPARPALAHGHRRPAASRCSPRRITPAAHARHTREYNAARAADPPARRRARRRARLGPRRRQLARRRSTCSSPAGCARRSSSCAATREFWTRAPLPAAGQRVELRPRPGGLPVLPRPRHAAPAAGELGQGQLARAARACATARWRAAAPPARCASCAARSTACSRLAARRGDFLAWEHYFSWGGGTPPWISGMTQATAVSALARAARALDEPRWREAAHARARRLRAPPPPLGVDGGDHFLMYSFSPGLRVFNGELQAVSGVGELAALWPDRRAPPAVPPRRARRARHGRGLRHRRLVAVLVRRPRGHARLPPADRGVPRRHVRAHRPARPTATPRSASPATSASRPASASRRCERLRARHSTAVRFRISKVSTVKVRLYGRTGLALSREMTLPYGAHQVGWTPPARGRYRLRIEAQGPSGPVGVKARTFRVVLPKPKPKKPGSARRRAPGASADGTPSRPVDAASGTRER